VARAVPIATGTVVFIAGAFQFTAWKADQLSWCRMVPGLPARAGAAWRDGVRLGLHCGVCCAGLMTILLVLGVMDLRLMAVVATAITVERLVPGGRHVARATGVVALAAGLVLIVRAAVL
jgi:predicted metal-binding membrane protein